MNESDFPQFDDPRVREVMAAAANVVEAYALSEPTHEFDYYMRHLKTALFAAQHSKTKCDCYDDGVGSVLGPGCQVHRTHEKPIEFDKWGFGKPVTNRFNVDGSKPGGKAFIAAVDHGMMCNCPKCVYK